MAKIRQEEELEGRPAYSHSVWCCGRRTAMAYGAAWFAMSGTGVAYASVCCSGTEMGLGGTRAYECCARAAPCPVLRWRMAVITQQCKRFGR
eukprot:3417888-Rhodomonas_salina.1